MKRLLTAFLLLSVGAAYAVDYPVVYVRAPLDPLAKPRLQDFQRQIDVTSGASLMILHPDGTEETLFTPPDASGVVYTISQVAVRLAGSRHHCLVTRQR